MNPSAGYCGMPASALASACSNSLANSRCSSYSKWRGVSGCQDIQTNSWAEPYESAKNTHLERPVAYVNPETGFLMIQHGHPGHGDFHNSRHKNAPGFQRGTLPSTYCIGGCRSGPSRRPSALQRAPKSAVHQRTAAWEMRKKIPLLQPVT